MAAAAATTAFFSKGNRLPTAFFPKGTTYSDCNSRSARKNGDMGRNMVLMLQSASSTRSSILLGMGLEARRVVYTNLCSSLNATMIPHPHKPTCPNPTHHNPTCRTLSHPSMSKPSPRKRIQPIAFFFLSMLTFLKHNAQM